MRYGKNVVPSYVKKLIFNKILINVEILSLCD
jgi:hypothetical protein